MDYESETRIRTVKYTQIHSSRSLQNLFYRNCDESIKKVEVSKKNFYQWSQRLLRLRKKQILVVRTRGQKRFQIYDPVHAGLVKPHRYCTTQLLDHYRIIKDGRIQIPRWTADGKEKKVYINWDIYVLFNFVDKRKLLTSYFKYYILIYTVEWYIFVNLYKAKINR